MRVNFAIFLENLGGQVIWDAQEATEGHMLVMECRVMFRCRGRVPTKIVFVDQCHRGYVDGNRLPCLSDVFGAREHWEVGVRGKPW